MISMEILRASSIYMCTRQTHIFGQRSCVWSGYMDNTIDAIHMNSFKCLRRVFVTDQTDFLCVEFLDAFIDICFSIIRTKG